MRHVPSLETMHAPTGVSGTHSLPNSEQPLGDAMPAMMSPQMHSWVSVDGAWFHRRRTSMLEFLARVDVRELVAQPQIAVGHVGDAAPLAAHRPEHVPQLLLRVAIAVGGHAAREHVDDARASVPHQLDQLHQRRQDVERLESGDDHRNLVPLDEALEDRRARDRRRVPGREEPFDLGPRHLGHDLHDRRDVLVRRQHGEVGRRIGEDHRGGRDGGGLEAAREEDDLIGRVARQLHRLGGAVHHVDAARPPVCASASDCDVPGTFSMSP